MIRTSFIIIMILCFSGLNFNVYAEAFKDSRPEVNKIITDFDNQGVLGKFIDKYGSDYFRPTATITREDLIMALYEYNKLNQTLMEYHKLLSQKISGMQIKLDNMQKEKTNLTQQKSNNNTDNISMNKIMAEVNKNLPSLIETIAPSKQVIKDIANINNKLDLLNKPYESISDKKIATIIKKSPEVKKFIKNEIQMSLSKNKPVETYSKSADKNNTPLTKISIGLSLVAILFMAR